MKLVFFKAIVFVVVISFSLLPGILFAEHKVASQVEVSPSDTDLANTELFTELPSLEASEVLINKIGVQKFFINLLRLHLKITSDTLFNKQKELISLALKKGLDPNLVLTVAIGQFFQDMPPGMSKQYIHLYDQTSLMDLALNAGAKFSKVDFIEGLREEMPTFKAAKMMFEHSKDQVDPNKFLNWVILMSSSRYNYTTETQEQDAGLVSRQLELVKLAIEKKADPRTIKYFKRDSYFEQRLPSVELSRFLVQNGLDGDTFARLVAKTLCIKRNFRKDIDEIDYQLIEDKKALVKAVLGEEAKIGEVNIPNLYEMVKLRNRMGCISKNNLELTNDEGKTLLMLAAEGGYTEAVERLVKTGADLVKRDKNGKTALDLARASGVLDDYLVEPLTPKQTDNAQKGHSEFSEL